MFTHTHTRSLAMTCHKFAIATRHGDEHTCDASLPHSDNGWTKLREHSNRRVKSQRFWRQHRNPYANVINCRFVCAVGEFINLWSCSARSQIDRTTTANPALAQGDRVRNALCTLGRIANKGVTNREYGIVFFLLHDGAFLLAICLNRFMLWYSCVCVCWVCSGYWLRSAWHTRTHTHARSRAHKNEPTCIRVGLPDQWSNKEIKFGVCALENA